MLLRRYCGVGSLARAGDIPAWMRPAHDELDAAESFTYQRRYAEERWVGPVGKGLLRGIWTNSRPKSLAVNLTETPAK